MDNKEFELKRKYKTHTIEDGPTGWFTRAWFAVVGAYGAVSYGLWSGESAEEMAERFRHDRFDDCVPIKSGYYTDNGKRYVIRPRSSGIAIHYPHSKLVDDKGKQKSSCDWFEAPCEVSNYRSSFLAFGEPSDIVEGQEKLYQKLESVYQEIFLNKEE
jgi:hypothetical protein